MSLAIPDVVRGRLDELDEPDREIIVGLYDGLADYLPTGAAQLKRKVDSFAVVATEELVDSMLGIGGHCLASLTVGHGPRPVEFTEAAVVRRRIEQGIPFEDVLLAFRIAFGLIREWIMTAARDHDLSPARQIRWLEVLWDVENAGETAFGSHSLRIAHEDGQRSELERANFVRELLLPVPGQARPARFERDMARYLSPEHEYRVIAARSHGTDPAEMIGPIGRAGELRDLVPQLIVHEGDIIGIVPRFPRALPEDFTLAVSEPVPPSRAAAAVPLTRRILDATAQCGLHGAYDLGKVGMLLAVTEQAELSVLYVSRYIDPLRRLGRYGTAIVDTLDVLLTVDNDLHEAARRLYLHPNTVRHRVRKAEEALGLRLNSLQHSRELWWAIAAWRTRCTAEQ